MVRLLTDCPRLQSPGPYQFFTYSKNGALLYVDETLVADNDGNHNLRWRTGSMTLNTGQHKVPCPARAP